MSSFSLPVDYVECVYAGVLGKWKQVWVTWKKFRLEVLGVAPMRECSVLIGTFLGARFLSEKHLWRRLAAACIILTGIVLLALG